MTLKIVVSPTAETQIQRIDAWWRENRLASPSLFADELAEALSTIQTAPQAGIRYPHHEVPGVRRVLMRATRHHVYYVPGDEAVVVVSVWGSIKGTGPDLKPL